MLMQLAFYDLREESLVLILITQFKVNCAKRKVAFT